MRDLTPAACEVWKAVQVRDRAPLRSEWGADRVLLDGGSGSGRTFDWSLLAGYAEPEAAIIAGGLRADNVAEAAALGSYALDVSSGVESAPGKKDPERMAAFFRARRRLPGRGDQAR